MEETITLKEILEVLRKNIWIIIGCMILLAAGSFAYLNFLVTPKYEATSQVLITQSAQGQNTAVQNSEIQANIQMVNTYAVVIKSPRILKIAAKEISPTMTLEALASKVSVDSVQNSQVINIHVVDDNPEAAIRIVQIVTKNFLKETADMMKINNVELLADAYTAKKISPNVKLGMLAGMLAGLVVGVIISFGRRMFDERFKKEEEITSRLQIPVIGTIGNIVDSEYRRDAERKIRRYEKKW
ncbi:capsular polysaccharide biosynthesis protein, putative chain length regulator [Listeria grandensis FSL F6-0971]|uniref:Capsular polysaccharide biosynthesis protein, putative chain length regulator n=1 Tax=Listeria grandensis FSL F6-0971 TaxID=1265819 RepID=W7BG38_9LIST|nr:Wzz/FepE/Etk N-terminal domain-containing protein [Listeria grandensis]EUJ18733.1 capsular polysaccharide biosynthesis protein, putative chain length regulator [Listeria grandensis FSL F6-0971]